MTEFFARNYYGNTVLQWLTTFLMILGVVIGGRAVYWVISRFLKAAALRNRVRIDDVLIDALEEPVVLFLILLGTRIALGRLALEGTWITFIDGTLGIAYALVMAWLITRIYDAIHRTYLAPLAQKTSGAFDDQILPLIRRGLKVIVWVLAIIVGLNNAGYDVGTVLAGLGIGGLAVALAAQDTVSNIFGGITIFAQKPFLIGDLIEFDGKQYTSRRSAGARRLRRTGTPATGLRSRTRSSRTGSSQTCRRRRGTGSRRPSGWRWTSGPRRSSSAIQDIKDSVCCHPKIDGHKVRFEGFGMNGFEFLVLFHVSSFDDRWQVITDANLDLMRRFEEHGIRIATPLQVTLGAAAPAAASAAATIRPDGNENKVLAAASGTLPDAGAVE